MLHVQFTAHESIQTCFIATFHLTISLRGQRATGKIQRNNYHHGSCGRSLTGKTVSVFLIFPHGTHRNVKSRLVRSSLKATSHSAIFRACKYAIKDTDVLPAKDRPRCSYW